MRISFTKMQGAGNDFIVLDETRGLLGLAPAHYRWLAHRHFGIGADQILSVRAAPHSGVDFAYVIHNADGQEVEHCGNGARCFVRYVHEKGLSNKNPLRVQTQKTVIELQALADGSVRVDMGAPFFAHADIPFNPLSLLAHSAQDSKEGALALWPIAGTGVDWSVLSMGNPHAVARFDDVASLDLAALGSVVQASPAFPNGVNVGVMQIVSQHEIKLRVFERGVGETLACGTGACAAVVAGICHGWLAPAVKVQTRGGVLHIEWNPSSGKNASVMMAGPAVTVFDAVIDIPDLM